jgi:hypothetical protein
MGMKSVHILSIFALVYIGVEITIGGWIVTYVIEERGGGHDAGYISSGFFGGESVILNDERTLVGLPLTVIYRDYRWTVWSDVGKSYGMVLRRICLLLILTNFFFGSLVSV